MLNEGQRRCAGYTLIEMMCVISLMVISLAIVGPPVTREHQRTLLRRSVSQFEAAHAMTRAVAMEYGRVAGLRINASQGRYFVVIDTSAALGSGLTALGEDKVMFGGIYRLYNNASMQSDRTLLCFEARGLPTTIGGCDDPDAHLVFSVGDLTKSLDITALGRIKR